MANAIIDVIVFTHLSQMYYLTAMLSLVVVFLTPIRGFYTKFRFLVYFANVSSIRVWCVCGVFLFIYLFFRC